MFFVQIITVKGKQRNMSELNATLTMEHLQLELLSGNVCFTPSIAEGVQTLNLSCKNNSPDV